MIEMKKGLVLAGTGHRPNRLGGYNDATTNRLKTLAAIVVHELEPEYGYCGGALGWDTAWGLALMNAGVPYCMALPFPDMGSKWFQKDRDIQDVLLSQAHKVHYLSDHYHKASYLIRDKYMVANAEGLVSLLDPTATSSGTYYTCQYAEELNLSVRQLWQDYIALQGAQH